MTIDLKEYHEQLDALDPNAPVVAKKYTWGLDLAGQRAGS